MPPYLVAMEIGHSSTMVSKAAEAFSDGKGSVITCSVPESDTVFPCCEGIDSTSSPCSFVRSEFSVNFLVVSGTVDRSWASLGIGSVRPLVDLRRPEVLCGLTFCDFSCHSPRRRFFGKGPLALVKSTDLCTQIVTFTNAFFTRGCLRYAYRSDGCPKLASSTWRTTANGFVSPRPNVLRTYPWLQR